MEIKKAILIQRNETNRIRTSSGEFLEFLSWKQNKNLGIGIGIHHQRFPKEGFLLSKKVDEAVILLEGKGSIIIHENNHEQRFILGPESVMFIPKNSAFCFSPEPSMEILSVTNPAWYPKQQSGLDYRRKESGRVIL